MLYLTSCKVRQGEGPRTARRVTFKRLEGVESQTVRAKYVDDDHGGYVAHDTAIAGQQLCEQADVVTHLMATVNIHDTRCFGRSYRLAR